MPATNDELDDLNSEQWRELYECASRLERTLRAGASAVDLRLFLPPPQMPHRRAVLHELIKIELEACYSRHQGCLLEDFLRRYPELGRPEDLPARLIYEEFRIRQASGEQLVLDDYRTRFPIQFERLTRLVHPGPIAAKPSPETVNNVVPVPIAAVPPVLVPMPSSPELSRSASLQMRSGSEGYRLLERIGKGQYGEVYRALAPGGVVVAVKRIFRSMSDESSQRELKALERLRELRHPYLLQTHNYYATEDRLTIVMELADGSLQDRLEVCREAGLSGIPLEELLRYFAEAAEALDFLHHQKLSHRDIKPRNLLHLQGHAKVADFGIARSQEGPLDHTMNVGGTPGYMPPEVWHGEISVHSDQYSFAVAWYEMRTGCLIFPGPHHVAAIAQQHLTQTPDVSGVPENEQNVLHRALAKDPEQRFPSCASFVQALQEATAPPLSPLSPPPLVQAVAVPGWGIKVAVVSLGFALVAVLIALWVVLWRGPHPPSSPENEHISWHPKGWEAEDAKDLIKDRHGRRYYRRLGRLVGSQQLVALAIPQITSSDPPTFYIMENKVWNDLFAVFMADPKAKSLLGKYSSRPGCERLVCSDWHKGAYAPDFNPDPNKEPFFGVEGPSRGRLPVFRVTVTEAHCFAEWLDGRLPTRQQWRKAAGRGEDTRPGPFSGEPHDRQDLAIGLLEAGPWPVDRGMRDVSLYGCRQMASNGSEWTRDLADKEPGETPEIPLEEMNLPRRVYVQGQSYLSEEPLTFQSMAKPGVKECTKADIEVSFRIIWEQ